MHTKCAGVNFRLIQHTTWAYCVRMARPRIYRKVSRTHINLPDDLKKKAAKYAFELGFTGGVSELVARLLVAELTTKNIASSYNRTLEAAK